MHATARQEGDGQPIVAAVYRSVRLFCYGLEKVADGRTAVLVNAYTLCDTNV